MGGDRLLESAVRDREQRAGEALHLGDEPLVADFVLVDIGHPAEEAGPVGEVVVEPVVGGEFQRVLDGACPRPMLLEALLHLAVAPLRRLPLPDALGEALGVAQLDLPVVGEDVEDVVGANGNAEFFGASDLDGAPADERRDDPREGVGNVLDDVADGEALASGVAERQAVVAAVLVAAFASQGGEEDVPRSAPLRRGQAARRLGGGARLLQRKNAVRHSEGGHPVRARRALHAG